MRDTESTSDQEELPLAIMEFIRSLRRVDNMDAMPAHRRQRIIKATAREVAGNFGIDMDDLISATRSMMEGHSMASGLNPRSK